MAKNTLSKEELIARLKIIAADETPRVENMGAMCYSEMAPPLKSTTCDACKGEIEYYDWNTHDEIVKLVKQIKALGYDAKLEILCEECADKLKEILYPDSLSEDEDEEDNDESIRVYTYEINHVFYFKLAEDSVYHRAIANDENLYRSLLTLLENKPMYSDSYDENHYIVDEINTLSFMTGINFNE